MDSKIYFENALLDDLPSIIALLANDVLGSQRENFTTPLPKQYINAFHEISHNKNAQLIVAKKDELVIAVAQINYLLYLTYQGSMRAQIEGVRVHQDYRGQGIGKQLFQHLIQLAEQTGCHLVQLTTDKARPDAFKFYESLGFKPSHEGFKLHINSNTII